MFDDFYPFTGRPFQLTPDPAFYFESLTHRKALSYLGYGLAQGEGFVVITGEVGAGKSTLVAHLMATIDPARLTATQVVTSRLDGDDLVRVVAQAFGLIAAAQDKPSALLAIETFLHEEARAGRRCLLVIDEAQNLSVTALEELRMLSNFQLGSHPLLQIVLLGQPEFRATLRDHSGLEQLRQRVIATHHLVALELAEVQPYVEYRLTRVGWTGNPSFEAELFAEMHAATGGIPRRVNLVASRLLLLGGLERCSRIDRAMLDQVLSELRQDGALPAPPECETPAVAIAEVPPLPPLLEPVPLLAEAPTELPAVAEHEPEEALPESTEPEPEEALPEPIAWEPEGALPETVEPEAEAWPTMVETLPALAGQDDLLADHGEQIAELQRAVLELADGDEVRRSGEAAVFSQIAALSGRIAALEDQMIEQERTIRYTLTMMIEWIEADGARRATAAA